MPSCAKLVTCAEYYYVAWTRVREQDDLFMSEPLPTDPAVFKKDLQVLLHDAKLQVAATRTRLAFAAAWGKSAAEIKSLHEFLATQTKTYQGLQKRMLLYFEECEKESAKKRASKKPRVTKQAAGMCLLILFV